MAWNNVLNCLKQTLDREYSEITGILEAAAAGHASVHPGSDTQGFRMHHSTETALVKVINDPLMSSDEGLLSFLVLLDLSAALDTIDHQILIQRLDYLTGIKGTA